jgi:hypothetical protein
MSSIIKETPIQRRSRVKHEKERRRELRVYRRRGQLSDYERAELYDLENDDEDYSESLASDVEIEEKHDEDADAATSYDAEEEAADEADEAEVDTSKTDAIIAALTLLRQKKANGEVLTDDETCVLEEFDTMSADEKLAWGIKN